MHLNIGCVDKGDYKHKIKLFFNLLRENLCFSKMGVIQQCFIDHSDAIKK